MKIMKELKDRLTSPTPEFWKVITKIFTSIGGFSLAVITINVQMSLQLNPTIITVLGYVAAICAGVVGAAVITKKDGVLGGQDENK